MHAVTNCIQYFFQVLTAEEQTHGDRPDVPDVVLLITDGTPTRNQSATPIVSVKEACGYCLRWGDGYFSYFLAAVAFFAHIELWGVSSQNGLKFFHLRYLTHIMESIYLKAVNFKDYTNRKRSWHFHDNK